MKQSLLPFGRLLGLDLGKVRTGLALCTKNWRVATPYKTIATKKYRDVLPTIITSERIKGLVIGDPISMDDTHSVQWEWNRELAKEIQILTQLPVAFMDERATSYLAEEHLAQQYKMNRKKKKLIVDSLAAYYILQNFIDMYMPLEP